MGNIAGVAGGRQRLETVFGQDAKSCVANAHGLFEVLRIGCDKKSRFKKWLFPWEDYLPEQVGELSMRWLATLRFNAARLSTFSNRVALVGLTGEVWLFGLGGVGCNQRVINALP